MSKPFQPIDTLVWTHRELEQRQGANLGHPLKFKFPPIILRTMMREDTSILVAAEDSSNGGEAPVLGRQLNDLILMRNCLRIDKAVQPDHFVNVSVLPYIARDDRLDLRWIACNDELCVPLPIQWVNDACEGDHRGLVNDDVIPLLIHQPLRRRIACDAKIVGEPRYCRHNHMARQ